MKAKLIRYSLTKPSASVDKISAATAFKHFQDGIHPSDLLTPDGSISYCKGEQEWTTTAVVKTTTFKVQHYLASGVGIFTYFREFKDFEFLCNYLTGMIPTVSKVVLRSALGPNTLAALDDLATVFARCNMATIQWESNFVMVEASFE